MDKVEFRSGIFLKIQNSTKLKYMETAGLAFRNKYGKLNRPMKTNRKYIEINACDCEKIFKIRPWT